MGLDMALTATCKGKLASEASIYWRKANAIHGWFVKNAQQGIDDCRTYSVDLNQLRQLVSTCLKVKAAWQAAVDCSNYEDVYINDVLRDMVGDLLPPTQGFFFGGCDIDADYMGDVQFTADRLTEILSHPDVEDYEFTYIGWW